MKTVVAPVNTAEAAGQRAVRPILAFNPVPALLSLLALAAVFTLPFLKVAPNRLVSGAAVPLTDVLRGPSWALGALLVTMAVASFCKPGRAAGWWLVAASITAINGLVWLAGSHASLVAQTASPLARTSLGGSFWTLSLLLGLIAADALQRLQVPAGWRTAVLIASALPLYALFAGGWCDDLSIMKEYANRSDVLGEAIAQHLRIVLLALLATLVIGLPLGWLARQRARLGGALFPLLNVIQTIPSIALFGLLMAPLAWLAASLPALARVGISGVGMAPGVIALTLYSLLPVVRGTLAGLEQVPSAVREAGRGIGMSAAQLFWRVDVPLAAPVVLGGIRTAAIQSVGLAAVTALIGAGGLGAIMFEGLFSSAEDLVLLGVVPIVVLGVVVDAGFSALIVLVQRTGTRSQPGVNAAAP